ncbi:MAG: Hpt domain-containing protein [Chlamydiales bacterium]
MPEFVCYDPENTFSPYLKGDLTLRRVKELEQLLYAKADVYLAIEDRLISTLLEKMQKGKPGVIVLFVTKSSGAAAFRQLKQKYGIDYILETPALKEEVEALVNTLSGVTQENNADMTSLLPSEIIEKYLLSIFDKCEDIENLIQNIAKSPTSKEPLVALRNIIHKIAGNAGSYGFPFTTDLCRGYEHYLEICYAKEPISQETKADIVKKNQAFFRSFKLSYQKISATTFAETTFINPV